jgi:APA family basic amino acid/polyamine antiporter
MNNTAPSLPRELNLYSAVALVVSNMIGTGIFATTGFQAGDLGRPYLVLAVWAAGALVAMAGCLTYAELGVNFPRSGGEYVYLREVWGPGWGFLSGWVSFFAGFAAPIAAGSLAFSEYLGNFFPAISISSQTASAVFGVLHFGCAQWVAIGMIAFFAAVNILGLRLAANLQNILTVLKLGSLVAFLGLAFTLGHGDWAHFHQATTRNSTHALSAQFAVSLIFVMFAYSGWNAACYVAEELKSPERTLPWALAIGTGLVGVLYLALNVAFIFALPLQSLKGVVRVGAVASHALFGPWAGDFFSAVMAVSLASCVSAMSLVGPRVYYPMAQDGCFPASAGRLQPRWRTPANAIVYQSVASVFMVLTGTFEALIYYIGFTLILSTALSAAGVFRMRRRPNWKCLASVSWCYPAVPAVFIATSLWMLMWTLALRPKESSLGLLTILCGGLLYLWMVRSGRIKVPAVN